MNLLDLVTKSPLLCVVTLAPLVLALVNSVILLTSQRVLKKFFQQVPGLDNNLTSSLIQSEEYLITTISNLLKPLQKESLTQNLSNTQNSNLKQQESTLQRLEQVAVPVKLLQELQQALKVVNNNEE